MRVERELRSEVVIQGVKCQGDSPLLRRGSQRGTRKPALHSLLNSWLLSLLGISQCF